MRLSLISLALVTACTSAVPVTSNPGSQPDTTSFSTTTTIGTEGDTSSETSATEDDPLDPVTERGLVALTEAAFTGSIEPSALDDVVAGGDVRAAWLLVDLLRFFQVGDPHDRLVSTFQSLIGLDEGPTGEVAFVWASNILISRNLPAWPGYPEFKRRIFGAVDPRWEPFFTEDHGVDWRLVTWGGVLADDRPFGDNGPCNCIPALDDPATTDATGGAWYPDEKVVFGVVVNGEAIALPKNQMEVHEMVNLTLGGRELGIPYCTLCGSAQAYLTDNVTGVDRVVLRTSGLLSRSNKVMYDLTTKSAFDTFTGRALTGPLGESGVVLEQVSVVGATWGDWKAAHPDTRILAQDGGIGRVYPDDPLRGRDDHGPIFPVGDVDPRLPIQEIVVGVVDSDGRPIAFPVAAAREALAERGMIVFEGVSLRSADGLRVFAPDGSELTSHQAFWFAWSQFHPDTLLWTPERS